MNVINPAQIVYSTSERRGFPQIAFLVCVLFYALLVAIGFNDIEEDAFIYFRFAANVADGYGYVFNIGGERIESCSGLLWLALITLLYKLPVHIVLSTKLLCFVFGVLCIREVLVLSQRFIRDRLLALFPAFLMVASIPFYTWSVRGLETALYWCVFLWLLDWVTDTALMSHWWMPALAVMNTRPEGFLMLTAVMPFLFLFARKPSCFWRNMFIVAAGFFAVTAWRFWYFHDLVPHPFYFKVNQDHAQSLRNLVTYGWYSGWMLLLLLALPGIFKPWQRRDMALLGGLFFSLLWAVFVFEDKVYNRHTGLALPFVYIVALMLLARWLPMRRGLHQAVTVMLVGLVFFTLIFSRYVHFRDSHQSPFSANIQKAVMQYDRYWPEVFNLIRNPDDFKANPDGLDIFSIRYNLIASVGDFVRMNYRDDVVVIYDQIGQAPWYAGRRSFFIDNLGLAYRQIGLANFHRLAENSVVYSRYEKVLGSMVRRFWPDEQRVYSEDEIIENIMTHNPAVIIVRKGLVANGRESILATLLKRADVLNQYRARFLLNNREIVFERIADQGQFVRASVTFVQVPPGATVQAIESFSWCSGSPCLVLSPLP